jgi:hypothetical protein
MIGEGGTWPGSQFSRPSGVAALIACRLTRMAEGFKFAGEEFPSQTRSHNQKDLWTTVFQEQLFDASRKRRFLPVCLVRITRQSCAALF